MRHVFNTLAVFMLLLITSLSIRADYSILDASPVSCATAAFSKSGTSSWYTISLKITNKCGVNLDFRSTTITFNNIDNLNTSFWGNFSPLSYPDNTLQITSTQNNSAGYLASLFFHIPEQSWANSILKPNQSFTINYGTSSPSYDPNSVKVYLENVAPPPPLTGTLALQNASAQPAGISQTYAVINILLNNQIITAAQVPWSSQISIPNLAPNTYTLSPVDISDNQQNKYTGVASPSLVTIASNQTSQSTITYTKVPNNGLIAIKVQSLPPALSGYTNPVAVTLTRQDGVVLNQNIPWNASTTISNLSVNSVYALSTPTISYNGQFCVGTFAPSSLSANASTAPVSNLSYTCSVPSAGRLMAYAPGWKALPSAASLAQAGYTHLLAAFGVFSTSNPGQIVNAFDSITAAYIASLHQVGIKVMLSLGGASSSIPNTSVDFHQVLSLASSPAVFESAFVSSVQTLVNQYGFDGIDIDIEHGLTGTGSFSAPTGDIATLANIINTLHQRNPSLLISLAPQAANISANAGFNDIWGNYAALIMQTASALSWVGVQIYNTGCCFGIDHVCYADDANNPDFSVAMAVDLLENWPQKDSTGRATGFQPYVSLLNPSQIVLGYPAPNSSGASDGAPVKPTSVIKRAIKCLKTAQKASDSCNTYVPPRAYSSIGGVFEWEITYDENNNFKFATDLKSCVLAGNC